MAQKMKHQEARCTFCGQTHEMAGQMICSGNHYLCRDCFEDCRDIFEGCETPIRKQRKPGEWTPRMICEELDRHIIGQDLAKKQIAVAVYHHQQSMQDKTGQIKRSNILMVGPTGSGKTLIAQTLAEMLNVPFVIADATKYTKAGYVGDNVENMVAELVSRACGNIQRAEHGIIYIDEIDKLCNKTERHMDSSTDPTADGVQHALLKLIEGCEITLTATQPNGMQKTIKLRTDNILFICGGAFAGLTEQKHTLQKREIGFSAEPYGSSAEIVSASDRRTEITPDDLRKYGIVPELLGRLPVIVQLDSLKEEDLIRILTEPENAITKEYEALMACDGVKLTFSSSALRRVAHESLRRGTGARGLKSILEEALLDLMYIAPDDIGLTEYEVTEADIAHGCHYLAAESTVGAAAGNGKTVAGGLG